MPHYFCSVSDEPCSQSADLLLPMASSKWLRQITRLPCANLRDRQWPRISCCCWWPRWDETCALFVMRTWEAAWNMSGQWLVVCVLFVMRTWEAAWYMSGRWLVVCVLCQCTVCCISGRWNDFRRISENDLRRVWFVCEVRRVLILSYFCFMSYIYFIDDTTVCILSLICWFVICLSCCTYFQSSR